MPTKTPIAKIADVAEKPLRAAAEETGKQFKAAGRDFIQQLFGTTNLTDSDVAQKRISDQKVSSQNIDLISRELKMMASQKDERKTSAAAQEESQEKQRAKIEHHREQVAEILDKSKGPTQEEIDRKRIEDLENEKLALKKQKKQEMMTPIEPPLGRKTGMPKRKSNPTRMQPPKTGENKIGRGGRE